jgi:hypothetical protein
MRCSAFLLVLSAAAVASGQSVPEDLLPSTPSALSAGLPAAPSGRSTVMGGEIQRVDPVRDQLRLKVPGGHTITILFDERTQVYQNGKKIPILSLHPEDHASIETTLDGSDIFALRIHMLSDLPDGHLHGKVISYDRHIHELKLLVNESNDAVTLVTTEATPVARVGQIAFSAENFGSADLVHGSLVDVTFRAGKTGPGVATRIDVLAVPGAEFIFRGNLSFLDLRAGRMSIADGSDRPMDVSFEPSQFPVSHDLQEGSLVKVTARFDGSRYVASHISPE